MGRLTCRPTLRLRAPQVRRPTLASSSSSPALLWPHPAGGRGSVIYKEFSLRPTWTSRASTTIYVLIPPTRWLTRPLHHLHHLLILRLNNYYLSCQRLLLFQQRRGAARSDIWWVNRRSLMWSCSQRLLICVWTKPSWCLAWS